MLKRTCYIITVIALVFTLFSTAGAASYITDAAKVRGSDYTSSPELAAKLDRVFSGDVGFYSDVKCTTKATAPLGSSAVPLGTTYYVRESGSGAVFSGTSCYIYANAVYNTLFGDVPYHGYSDTWQNSECVASAKGDVSYNDFANWGVKTGSLFRSTPNTDGSYNSSQGHSVIILSYNSGGVTYLEGNGDGRGLIRITYRTWEEFNSALLSGRGYKLCFIVSPKDTGGSPSPEYIGYFRKTENFSGYYDVNPASWYYACVKDASELGLVNGRENGLFCPDGNVTAAEAVTLAARLCSRYWDDRADFTAYQGAWYKPYYDYLEKWGVTLPSTAPDDAITRAELTELIVRVIPAKELSGIREAANFADVSEGSGCYSAVAALSRAGVIEGSGGLFRPDSAITRAETVAVLSRVADKSLRIS